MKENLGLLAGLVKVLFTLVFGFSFLYLANNLYTGGDVAIEFCLNVVSVGVSFGASRFLWGDI